MTLMLSETERTILAPPRRQTIRQYAAERLRITEGPMVGGEGHSTRWHPDTFPLQATVMDACGDKRWRHIWLMTGPQTFGKTESAALPPILHAIGHRRVSALYVASRLPLAITQWRKKILPAMLADDQELGPLVQEDHNYAGDKNERRFKNGTSLHFAGSESVGAISGFTVAVVICDDIQAYVQTLPGFGHPVDVAFARAGSYPQEQRTLIGCGTAGTVDDYLWRSLSASAMFCPVVPCPECGAWQMLNWSRLVYAETPAAAQEDTWMRCAGGCRRHIVFDDLPGMLAKHRWVSPPPGECWVTTPMDEAVDMSKAAVYPETNRPTSDAGFWSSALYWPLGQTWGQRAAEWMQIRGDPDKAKDFQQAVLAIPYREPEPDENALTIEDLASHTTNQHQHLQVPAEADTVTLTADVHDRYLYYIVRAWRKADGTSWLVDAGTLGVHGPKKSETLSDQDTKTRVGHAIRLALEDLWEMENRGWIAANGQVVRATLGLIDGGYRPDVVGQFCQARNAGMPARKWEMVEGSRATTAVPIWPRSVRRNQRGQLWREIGTAEGKHLLRELLSIPHGRPGAWHTYADKPLDAYYRHMVSEHWVPTVRNGRELRVWQKREGAGPNHWWDCEVYQVAAGIAVGVSLPGQIRPAATTAGARDKTAWFSARKR